MDLEQGGELGLFEVDQIGVADVGRLCERAHQLFRDSGFRVGVWSLRNSDLIDLKDCLKSIRSGLRMSVDCAGVRTSWFGSWVLGLRVWV